MKKILFLIHDLGQGGAEKVLINLVNNMDRSKFDISVSVLFGGGINEQFLAADIRFHAIFPRSIAGNSKIMKILSPKQLHQLFIKESYDIEVSYLEGPTARIISGCENPKTKLVCWIHSTYASEIEAIASFRSFLEAERCYARFQKLVFVSKGTWEGFRRIFPNVDKCCVLYNAIESNKILSQATAPVPEVFLKKQDIALIAVGSLKPIKGFDRLVRIHTRLRINGYRIHTYILGKGPDKEKLQFQATKADMADSITFLGYDTNPYRYVAKCDLFVCSSYSEGFSTAVMEALIVGTPVCAVNVSGMKELLGENSEYGIITENSEDALYQGIKLLLDSPVLLAHYKKKAMERGKLFSIEETVQATEKMLMEVEWSI